jgi:hypothetical protein
MTVPPVEEFVEVKLQEDGLLFSLVRESSVRIVRCTCGEVDFRVDIQKRLYKVSARLGAFL